MLYVCYGADEIYQGLHGMYNCYIEDCNDENDALHIARDLSFDVIDSFPLIYETLEEDYEEAITENMSQREKDDVHTDIYKEDTYFNVWKIKENICKNYSQEELEEILDEDFEFFIEEYCE